MVTVDAHLRAALEKDLAPFDITMGDYEMLAILSEVPDNQMRMCDLAERLGLSPSGLTRRLDGLVKSRCVTRTPSAEDGRVTMALLTERGHTAMDAAAPTHLESVRARVIDVLSPEQIAVLGDIFTAIGNALGRPPALA